MFPDLTTPETETLEEPSAPPGDVLHNAALNVDLELEEINSLPVGTVQSENVPRFRHL